jgi:riboflavin kinase/FMN adenylyltransferase
MLGRQVSVLGRVVRGNQLGRQIGFPTANLDLHHELHPPPGVYAVGVVHVRRRRARRTATAASCNIGFRPTVGGSAAQPQVEVHILDFAGEPLRERSSSSSPRRLRSEKRFPDLAALKAQIALDVAEARPGPRR